MSKIVDAVAHPFLRIAACSYEGSLFGWKIEENVEQVELTSKLTFGFNASIGTLKAIAVSHSGKFLVVGGMDERIRIYDMHDNKAVGELSQHTGAVTSLKFFKDSYLISASEDFNLCIWRVYDWQCVHILGGHKDTILDFSIHPTGKMALSVSKDHTLKLWNLVQGRCAFTRRLKAPTEQVIWHDETGDFYLLVSHRDIQLFKASDNSILATLTHGSRINRACFTTVSVDTAAGETAAAGYRMVTVCDNKTINMFDFSGKQTCCVDLSPLGSARPRDVYSADPNVEAVQNPDMLEVIKSQGQCLVVATSLGQIIVLSANALEHLGMAGAAEVEGATEDEAALNVESAVLSNHQIKAEPRLTAVVAWNPATAAAAFVAKGNKRPKAILECEGADEVDTDDDSVDSELAEARHAANNTKPTKKKKTAQLDADADVDADTDVTSQKKGKGPRKDNKAVAPSQETKKVKFGAEKNAAKKLANSTSANANASVKAPVANNADKKRKNESTTESNNTTTNNNKKPTKQVKIATPAQDSDDDDDRPAKVISFEDAYPREEKTNSRDSRKLGGGKEQKKTNKKKNNYAQRKTIH